MFQDREDKWELVENDDEADDQVPRIRQVHSVHVPTLPRLHVQRLGSHPQHSW